MDVHAPHEPIHSARDFFLHLFTITVGLLIALSLEAAVEHLHNNHLLHTAETNLQDEMKENRDQLAGDNAELTRTEAAITANLNLLIALQSHQPVSSSLNFHWQWNGMNSAAWDTARNTGAVALMPYDSAQSYSLIYRQQSAVDDQATLYIRDIYRSAAPLQGNRQPAQLTPAELETLITASRQTLVDLNYLRDLCNSLNRIYIRAASSMQ